MEKISKIYFIRHGESVANTKGIYQGQTYDTDLSVLGKKQAKTLAKAVKKLGIKRIIASPLKRTMQTAKAVSKETGIPVETNNLIIETNHGKWEGKNKEWIKENYPNEYDVWMGSPSRAKFPGGETFMQTAERVRKFVTGSVPADTLIVTHDNIVRILAVMADNLSLDKIWQYEIEPAAINIFEIVKSDGKKKLKAVKLNDNKHLKNFKTDLSKHAL